MLLLCLIFSLVNLNVIAGDVNIQHDVHRKTLDCLIKQSCDTTYNLLSLSKLYDAPVKRNVK